MPRSRGHYGRRPVTVNVLNYNFISVQPYLFWARCYDPVEESGVILTADPFGFLDAPNFSYFLLCNSMLVLYVTWDSWTNLTSFSRVLRFSKYVA